ncbi:hypothetical protein BDW22DRAFT_964765 [Trametopsis cervina]|nr:hypothetical protein BDW22DRAFT_964765 [Trametopsis cervina]
MPILDFTRLGSTRRHHTSLLVVLRLPKYATTAGVRSCFDNSQLQTLGSARKSFVALTLHVPSAQYLHSLSTHSVNASKTPLASPVMQTKVYISTCHRSSIKFQRIESEEGRWSHCGSGEAYVTNLLVIHMLCCTRLTQRMKASFKGYGTLRSVTHTVHQTANFRPSRMSQSGPHSLSESNPANLSCTCGFILR